MHKRILQAPDHIYLEVAHRVSDLLRQTCSYTTSQRLRELQYRVRMTDPATIDYEDFCLEYAKLYWSRNYWKSVYLFEYEYHLKHALMYRLSSPDVAIRVASLGAGPAADIVAFLVWLNAHQVVSKVQLSLTDKSPAQIDLLQQIINCVIPLLTHLQIEVEYICADIATWIPVRESIDILIMGHFLTANRRDLEIILHKAQYAVARAGDILIVERDRDPVWQTVEDTLLNMAIGSHSIGADRDRMSHMIERFADHSVDRDVAPRYLRTSLPTYKDHIQLVQKYFESWQLQTADYLSDIFVDSAVYDEKPGVEPVREGIDKIYGYWRDNPMSQRQIDVHMRSIAYDEETIVCAFEGEFDTPKQHIAIRGALDLKIDMYEQKVRSFRSYFGTIKTPFH